MDRALLSPEPQAGSTNAEMSEPDVLPLRAHRPTEPPELGRNLILNLGLFAAGVWLARNLSDIDLMAPQPGV
ncbi:mitochondrial import receptor [Lynx pardinus]|uniref:Mitochondrial import receptor n=1 Tax=Lynx pardinus TaxID=191816 RepID=A0A485MCA4_LYNPA|nr:mitochondrial import receptor [Lynx pardinus]